MCSGMTASPGGCRPVESATTTVSVSLPAGQQRQAGEIMWGAWEAGVSWLLQADAKASPLVCRVAVVWELCLAAQLTWV